MRASNSQQMLLELFLITLQAQIICVERGLMKLSDLTETVQEFEDLNDKEST